MTTSGLSIKQLELADMDAAAGVHRLAFDHALPWLIGLHTPEEDRWFYRERVFTGCQVHGAFEGGALAGIIAFRSDWIDEPVPQENLSGHAQVREMSPTPLQAGENWWFPRGFAEAIEAGASDFIMPDLMKCGGVTGWLQVAAQAKAANIPMSSHLFAEASAHMLPVTPTAHWLEFLDFAGVILAHPAEIVDGTVTARGPGLGLEWNETAVAKYQVT